MSDNTPAESRSPTSTDPLKFRRLARRYLAAQRYEGVRTLAWWRGNFWQWSAAQHCYQQRTFIEQKYLVLDWLGRNKFGSANRMAEDVTHCLVPMVMLPTTTVMPQWLIDNGRHTWHLSLANYLVDPLGVAAGNAKMYQKHTPLWFSNVQLPYQYDSRATCPKFLQWLHLMMEGDTQRISLLQEFMGYWLTPDTARQCGLFLVGEGGTGKSTLINVVKNLVGIGNCSFLGLSSFGEKHAMCTTEGKLLNISDETGDFPASAESVFKWFLGGTEMQFEPKFVNRYTAKPTARLLVAMNPPGPRIRDMTEAVYRRIRIIPMDHRIDPRSYDTQLWQTQLAELPGIFNWAVQGLARLLRQGFGDCEAGARLLGETRRRNQPHVEFINSCIISKMGSFITVADLRDAYVEWCKEEGVKAWLDTTTLSRHVLSLVKDAEAQRRRVGNKQIRGIANVTLT